MAQRPAPLANTCNPSPFSRHSVSCRQRSPLKTVDESDHRAASGYMVITFPILSGCHGSGVSCGKPCPTWHDGGHDHKWSARFFWLDMQRTVRRNNYRSIFEKCLELPRIASDIPVLRSKWRKVYTDFPVMKVLTRVANVWPWKAAISSSAGRMTAISATVFLRPMLLRRKTSEQNADPWVTRHGNHHHQQWRLRHRQTHPQSRSCR